MKDMGLDFACDLFPEFKAFLQVMFAWDVFDFDAWLVDLEACLPCGFCHASDCAASPAVAAEETPSLAFWLETRDVGEKVPQRGEHLVVQGRRAHDDGFAVEDFSDYFGYVGSS